MDDVTDAASKSCWIVLTIASLIFISAAVPSLL